MSIDRTRPYQRGLLVHDQRVTLDRDDAAHTWVESGPRPGVPESQDDPRSLLVLKASGEQEAGASLQVQTIRSGFPGTRTRAGAYVYRDAADDDWRGWDVPNAINGWEWVLYQEAPSLLAMSQPHLLRLHDGGVLLAIRYDGLVGTVVQIRRFDPETGEWTSLADVAPPSAAVAGPTGEQLDSEAWPCLVQLPGGRVLLFAWVSDVGGSYTQLSMWYSDDDGETWTRGERWCLASSLDDTGGVLAGKSRIAYNNGQLLLVAEVDDGADRLTQWASDDLGARFHHVETFDAATAASPEILPRSGGGYMVLWVDPVTDTAHQVRIGSAWHPIPETTAANIALPATWTGGVDEIALWRGEDGAWYLAMRHDATEPGGQVLVQRSLTEGASWESTERLGYAWPADSGTQMIRGMAAVETSGRTILVANITTEENTPDIDGGSVICLYLGGHSTVTMPSDVQGRREPDQAAWDAAWVATDPPDAWTGWALTTSGVTTATIASGGLEVTTSAAGVRTYTCSFITTGSGYEAVALVEVMPDSIESGAYLGIALWGGDGIAANGAEVRISDEGFTLVDAGGTAGQLGDAVAETMIGRVWQFVLAVGGGSARCWYREVLDDGSVEREWTAGPAGDPTDVSGSGDVGHLRLRNNSGTGGATGAVWRLAAGVGIAPAVGLAAGPSYPTDLFPRPYAAHPVRLPGGIQIEATDGPTLHGETWHVDPRYEFGLDAADPLRAPSPRRVARTEITGAQVVYQLSGVTGEATLLDTSTWGVGIYGASTCDVQLHGYDPDTASWVALTSGSSWVTGLAYERVGDAIHPDPSDDTPADEPLYVERDMLRGAVIDLGGGALRRVRANTEGWWGPGVSRRPVLYLDPEYLTGAEPTSGTCSIGPAERGQVILVHGLDRYERLRVTYGTGYGSSLEVGVVVVGPALLFGQEYSHGRTLTTSPDTTLTTLRGGSRHARREGPSRRAVEFGWAEGVLERPLWGEWAPDYIRGVAAGEPVAVAADVGPMLSGLLEQLDGPRVPVVYLPAVPSDASEVRLLWPSQHMYGRIVSDIRRETVTGDERRDELVRVASILIEEEV